MFNSFVLQGIVKRQYAMILSLLLSLRQCCDHPFLLLSRANGLLKKQDDEEIEKALTSQFIQQIYSQSFESRENVTSYAHSVLKEIQQKGSLCSLLCPVCFCCLDCNIDRFVVNQFDSIRSSLHVFIISVKIVLIHLLNKQEYSLRVLLMNSIQ